MRQQTKKAPLEEVFLGLFVWLAAIGMFSNVKLVSELLDILAFDYELNRHSLFFVEKEISHDLENW